METIKILQETFRDVFDNEDMEIYPEMSAHDYEDWDSLSQIQLIVASERKFNVKFSTDEVMKLKNVGEFVELIDSKIKINS